MNGSLQLQSPFRTRPTPARSSKTDDGAKILIPSTSASPANAAIRASSRVPITRSARIWRKKAPPTQMAAIAMCRNRKNSYQVTIAPLAGLAGRTILRQPDDAVRSDACVRFERESAVPAEYDRRLVATDSRPELDSILGTVPGLVFRSRIAPDPYLTEFVSDEMSSIAGYPASDFRGTEPRIVWTDLMHPEDRERVATTIRGAPANGQMTEVEYRALRADGSYAWCLSRLRKLVADDGSIWVHGAALDVTARHEAEDLRRKLDAEHARAEALEESRLRIVEAGDAARRRLERDLHDGAQQRLIVSLMTLRRAAAEAKGTPAAPLVDEAIGHLSEGLAELRELARGIHPSHLAEQGLGHAVGLLAERAPLPVDVDVPGTR